MESLLRHNEEDLLFKGKSIHCRNEPLFKGRGDSFVYRGFFKNKAEDSKEEIVVRKIMKTNCDDKWEDIFNKHTREADDAIKHENVLKIIGHEEINGWRFFALEPYDATLEQFCKGFYRGPMPSNAQVLCQIAKGLLHLHKLQCSHGNLTPRTILIASSQPVRMMIKLSEFGLSKFSDQCDEGVGKQQELCQRKYWTLNGTADSNQIRTPNQDIFSAGCLFFYFLKRGLHPFGDDESSILENIKNRNPVNLKTVQQEKNKWEFAYDPIENMIGDPPTDGTYWLMIAKDRFKKALPLRFEEKKENELGRGGYGIVYRGTFEGNTVAVKVTDNERKKEQKQEIEEHLRFDHENVLKLLYADELRDKMYLVLELCAGTLTDYCEKKYNGPELPPDGLVLYQIANGLHYVHSRNLVHRDVKPDNILISMTTPVQIKLADFKFVKKTSPRGTFEQSGIKGTFKWMAPEILELLDDNIIELPHGTIQSDTFALGCVFFYFLTRGKHPFGSNSILIQGNILNDNPIELNQHEQNLQGDDRALYELIGKMVKINERIALPEVIEQLTAKLDASRQFKKFEKSVSEWGKFVNSFHPTEPVLACGSDKVILLSADNSSIPFSNWKEKETQLKLGNLEASIAIEWNVDGTQLAAIASNERDVMVWSYPSGEILFQIKTNLKRRMNQIEWNPFRPNVFATFEREYGSEKVVSFFNSCPVDQRQFLFCTVEGEKQIFSFQWISENRFALGLSECEGIEILEIDESIATAQIVQRFQHESVTGLKLDVAWDERTKCLAACSFEGWMTIWSMDSDQLIHATKMEHSRCWRLAWRPNGKQTDDEGVDAARKLADNFILVCGLDEGKIVVWTPLAEKQTRILSRHSDCVDSLSFSPDGRFLASEDEHGKLIIWATENWEPVYIDEEERWGEHFSWLSSSTDVPACKLTFNSFHGKVPVVEYAVGQSEMPSEDGRIVSNEDWRRNSRPMTR